MPSPHADVFRHGGLWIQGLFVLGILGVLSGVGVLAGVLVSVLGVLVLVTGLGGVAAFVLLRLLQGAGDQVDEEGPLLSLCAFTYLSSLSNSSSLTWIARVLVSSISFSVPFL